MSEIRVVHRALWWACVVAGCNGEAAISARAEPLGAARSANAGQASGTPDQGSAGEPPLSEAELDRMLDALEQQITSR